MVSYLMLSSGQSYNNLYLINLLLTPEFVLYENLREDTLVNHPYAMKYSMTHDPDTPRLRKAIIGEHQDDFLTEMGKDIK